MNFDLETIRKALAEDVGTGDLTTLATVPADLTASAVMAAREPLVICGLPLAEAVFKEVCAEIQIEREAQDGQQARKGQALLRLRGPAGAMLTGERVALNFVQRLSGVATLTARFVEAVAGTRARILDTRKTTPGLRALEKYAVRCGGGTNHRFGLFDRVLIKDNHLAALRLEPPNAIEAALRRAREREPGREVEVEAGTLEEVERALLGKADVILLDNMFERAIARRSLAGQRPRPHRGQRGRQPGHCARHRGNGGGLYLGGGVDPLGAGVGHRAGF